MGIVTSARNFRATVREWQEFKLQTGRWPLLSILTEVIFVALAVVFAVLLIWYGEQHSWSGGRAKMMGAVIVLTAGLPVLILWTLLEEKVRLYEIRRARAAMILPTVDGRANRNDSSLLK